MRTKILLTGIIAFAVILLCGCAGTKRQAYDPDKQQVYIGENIAVAETGYGKVKGFILRDIFVFKGIPYGADTGGENRFRAPQPPEPWEGVRPTVAYGSSAPQSMYDRSPESYGMFVDHWNYDVVDEDCLRLNVWTPGLDNCSRPVVVWLHGGGYARGNGIEQDSYDGENFARFADAVFVSINHRLNVFGFSDLSDAGAGFEDSANAGMLDIIAALKWVNENIANFGGDPGNVTIMGQSGGGSKVCTVASMPAAKGLVHKGVALSGNSTGANDKEYARTLGRYILAEAGIEPFKKIYGPDGDISLASKYTLKVSPEDIKKLQQMPWQDYMDIAERAAARYRNENPGRGRGGFSPTADGRNIPEGSFFKPDNTDVPDIPMLFCSTFHEWNPDRDDPQFENLTLEGVAEKLAGSYRERAAGVVRAYADNFPELRPIEIWSLIASNRRAVVNAADTKCKQQSPVYMAWFGWESPLFDGRHRSFHCIDIGFWFLNTNLMITHTGGGKRPRDLSRKMASSLSAFLRTGDPNCKELPRWPQYSPETGPVMILNDKCEVADDPDRAARQSLTAN